jgi:hypothetical protein
MRDIVIEFGGGGGDGGGGADLDEQIARAFEFGEVNNNEVGRRYPDAAANDEQLAYALNLDEDFEGLD